MMLVSKDSPLRRIPVNIPTKQILYFDGIRYSVETIDLAFGRLGCTLEKIVALPGGADELGPYIVEAMSDAWTIVDSIHRLRQLVRHVPGLKQKLPEVQLFLRRTSSIEDLRNFVQHFATEIHEFVEKRMALCGVLMWAPINDATENAATYTIAPGTFFHGANAGTCTFDTVEGRFVERLVLRAGPARVDLADMYDRCERFWKWFEALCAQTFTEENRHGAEVRMKITIELKPRRTH